MGSAEAFGVAAAAAEGGGADAFLEAFADRAGQRGGEDLRQVLAEEVSQRERPLVVQAAGHDRAVTQHGDLLAQPVAELGLRPAAVLPRPVEFLPRL